MRCDAAGPARRVAGRDKPGLSLRRYRPTSPVTCDIAWLGQPVLRAAAGQSGGELGVSPRPVVVLGVLSAPAAWDVQAIPAAAGGHARAPVSGSVGEGSEHQFELPRRQRRLVLAGLPRPAQ